LKNLVDYLAAGDSLEEFLDHFPSVTREQAMAVRELAAKECCQPVRVLLDESLPRPLATLLSGHEVRIVAAAGWSGVENGELLRLAAERFNVLITADRNLSISRT
jgi:hypothetical protein